MKITILTLFPEMFDSFLSTSIIKRAIDEKHVTFELVNFREYTTNKHMKVDDTPYGGGPGMLLCAQPVVDCLEAIKTEDSYVILLSPQGHVFKQGRAHELSEKKHLIFVCGHYEGFDERIRSFVDIELSLGDFVLTGGETASMVMSDAIVRLLDGVIVKQSHEDDSFENGLLEYPQYTKPADFRGMLVPEVLKNGHHEEMRKWKLKKSLEKTLKNRPDLLEGREFTKEELQYMQEITKGKEDGDELS